MTQLRLVTWSLASSAALLLATLAPRVALADECSTTADCDKGFECAVVGSGSCPGAAPCVPGSSCPEPEPCTVTEVKECIPAQCASDQDCGAGMVCHAWEKPCAVSDCACSSDQPSCDCGEPVDCTDETVNYCTPKYVLPCKAASDCGEGFDCVEQVTDSCSGSGGSAGAPRPSDKPGAPLPPEGSGGSSGGGEDALPTPDPAPKPPECTSTPSGVFACVPKDIACDATSDCPSGWLCEQQTSPTEPGCAGEGCPEAKPAPPPVSGRLCRPEYQGSIGVDQDSGSGTPTANPSAPGSNNGGQPEAARDADDAQNESSACQMGHAPASQGALSILALLGALFGLKRRRA